MYSIIWKGSIQAYLFLSTPCWQGTECYWLHAGRRAEKVIRVDNIQTFVALNKRAWASDTPWTQPPLWTSHQDLLTKPGHPDFTAGYQFRINPLMSAYGHDCFVSRLSCLGETESKFAQMKHHPHRAPSLIVSLTKATQHSDTTSRHLLISLPPSPFSKHVRPVKDYSSNMRAIKVKSQLLSSKQQCDLLCIHKKAA